MIADQILYEDNHLIALNKLPGQITQGDKTGDPALPDLVKAYLKERDAKPGNVFCGVVHRLDRPVSGVVLLAKTSKALSRMTQMVAERRFEKTYWAVVRQAPPTPFGELTDWLLKNEQQNKSYVVDSRRAGAKEARLSYKELSQSQGGYHLLEINLHTGRHHQIRCQLAHMGCPIRGDLKYGAPRSLPDGSIGLHARCIAFEHPVSHAPMFITAPNTEIETMFNTSIQ